jgi:hypothetical protein
MELAHVILLAQLLIQNSVVFLQPLHGLLMRSDGVRMRTATRDYEAMRYIVRTHADGLEFHAARTDHVGADAFDHVLQRVAETDFPGNR